mmetsp:Transcript_71718/g.226652  ORF Transcript_71718/g.226652 Transcript_71718/m.226652 type:complete len:82 (+) Transcript_71718:116-361(+)
MRCLLDVGRFQDPTLLVRLQSLSEKPLPSKHSPGGRFNNSGLERTLEEQPQVAEPLAALRGVLDTVYRRQQRIYGCPMPKP